MKRVLLALIFGTVLSGAAAAYAALVQPIVPAAQADADTMVVDAAIADAG